ncbi:MAG: HD domain-containing phosphohydrolase, partial [Lutispora sp.]
QIIYQHHERYDGKGYPLGLHGMDILTEAKILALADAFDAMTSARPYKETMTISEAIEEIKRKRGTQFDPEIASSFIEMVEKEFLK